jgi:hypothetical protein
MASIALVRSEPLSQACPISVFATALSGDGRFDDQGQAPIPGLWFLLFEMIKPRLPILSIFDHFIELNLAAGRRAVKRIRGSGGRHPDCGFIK